MTDELFNVLDVDHSGAISFAEALAGLKRLRVSINEDEWMQLTAGISDGAGTINRKGFATMMQRQLKAFAQRQVVNSMRAEANGSLYEVRSKYAFCASAFALCASAFASCASAFALCASAFAHKAYSYCMRCGSERTRFMCICICGFLFEVFVIGLGATSCGKGSRAK